MANSPVDLLYLPDDLLLNCLARVSRLYYPTLSLVSKRFHSLVSSHELNKIRTLLGRTDKCLYVYLRLSSESNPRWFALYPRPTRIPNPNPVLNSRWFTSCFRPNKMLTNHIMEEDKKSSDNLMGLVSTPNFTTPSPSTLTRTTIFSNIYMAGRIPNSEYTSRELLYLDCRSHTWHQTPSMQVARKKPHMRVLDGKIYVLEACKNPDYLNLIEVFDPDTQIWEHVPSPNAVLRGSYVSRSLVFDEKLYLFGDKNLAYTPKENKWEVAGFSKTFVRWVLSNYSCIVDNVVYYYGWSGHFFWYYPKGRAWRILKGLGEVNKLPTRSSCCLRLVTYGEKIVVFWEKKVRGKKKMIWCAEIAIERRNELEIYGKIEWCDVVLTVPQSCSFLKFQAVTI